MSRQRRRIGHAVGIPWQCIHEFLAIVPHPRINDPPTPLADALEQAACWIEVPIMVLLAEATGYWPALRETLDAGGVTGRAFTMPGSPRFAGGTA
jgi:hypothetical protein